MQTNLVVEAQPAAAARKTNSNQAARRKVNEHRKRMMEAVNKDAYNGVDLFEGTQPMTSHESSAPKAGSVDLGSPSDSGVDISSLVGDASKIWNAMK
mgnify:FL=1